MGFPDLPLGERMHAYGVVLNGRLSETRWRELLVEIAAAIGMSPVFDPAVWTYPVDGKGGSGQTIVLPITESFLALDTWPDHRGAYLFVCSCREYDGSAINAVAAQFGLQPRSGDDHCFAHELKLT